MKKFFSKQPSASGSLGRNGFIKLPQKEGERSRWCPEEEAGPVSSFLFLWVSGLLRLGYKKMLEAEDLWDLPSEDTAEKVASVLEVQWASQTKKEKPSLLRALRSSFGTYFGLAGLLKLAHDVLQLLSPVLVRAIIQFLKQPTKPLRQGVGLAALLLLANVLQTACNQHYLLRVFRTGLHVRTSLISLIYNKALRISTAAKQETSVGEIVNLQSNDVQKLSDCCQNLHVMWAAPLQISGALGLLFAVLGVFPALAGLAVMLLMMPVNVIMARYLTRVRKRLIAWTDRRVKLITEVIYGIKAIKLYAWEEPFTERVNELRTREVQEVRTTIFFGVFNDFLYGLNPTLVALASFSALTLMGVKLDATIAFPALALFNILRFPLTMLPRQINQFIQAGVAIGRVQRFLVVSETEHVPTSSSAPGSISLKDASFSWAPPVDIPGHSTPVKVPGQPPVEIPGHSTRVEIPRQPLVEVPGHSTLSDITLSVAPGALVMVVGEVGSGKSSLLAALLGEIRQLGGSVAVNGSIAYTAQDPWIQNATVQENIVVKKQLDASRYQQTLEVCALTPDLRTLPGGDQAEIGEKGINLSGGQKHRVALARAVYSDSDIYLLDDPLSAVDTHVGRHLFDNCICGFLKAKTRVLVTHQLQYVQSADAIVVMKEGRIAEYGSYEELQAKGVDFAQFEGHQAAEEPVEENGDERRSSHKESADGQTGKSTGEDVVLDLVKDLGQSASEFEGRDVASRASVNQQDVPDGDTEFLADRPDSLEREKATRSQQHAKETELVKKLHSSAGFSKSVNSDLSKSADEEDDEKQESEPLLQAANKAGVKGDSKLVRAEAREVGRVKRALYWRYISAWGPGFWVPILVLNAFTVSQTCKLLTNAWLAVWTEGIRRGSDASSYYLSVYALMSALTSALTWARALALASGCVTAGRNLHARLLARVLQLPMSFFDSTPTGRLISRFTRDTEQVDLQLPDTFGTYLTCAFQVVFELLIIIYVTPLFVLPLLPLLFLYVRIQSFYIASSRELKRLDSISRSPIFAHFGESIQGLATIRAFKLQRTFMSENEARVNASARARYAGIMTNRWLGVRLELLGSLTVFGTALAAVWAHQPDAGFAGLALTAALSVTGFMSRMVRMQALLELEMNAVERVVEYSKLTPEAPPIVPTNRPPSTWPSQGAIQAEQLVVRYRPDLDPVLKGLSFSIRGGEKVGICGRTGCGKTTLMMALYRIMELTSGRLLIDGLDVSKIGLRDLRSRLALVPQDPVVFSGSIRRNLDPFQSYEKDAELWDALKQASLADFVRALPGQLDAEVFEGGANMSVGQRQLLCMARALLRKARILVLDEATSNVDSSTDAVIQDTVRQAFKSCTLLTIAHRLHTIIDSDRVLLLDSGRVAEFAPPSVLLADDSSLFTGFVKQTLPKQAAALRRAASNRNLLDAAESEFRGTL